MYDPNKRATAEDCLDSSYFKEQPLRKSRSEYVHLLLTCYHLANPPFGTTQCCFTIDCLMFGVVLLVKLRKKLDCISFKCPWTDI